MLKEYFENLFEYENWANKVIIDNLLSIPEPPEKAVFIMSHIINAQVLWISRIKKSTAAVSVWQIYDKENIADKLKDSSAAIREFLKKIEDNDLGKMIGYTNTKGDSFTSVLKDILTHMAIHSSYHRGQIVLLIKPFVKELPYTDFIVFMRSIKKINK